MSKEVPAGRWRTLDEDSEGRGSSPPLTLIYSLKDLGQVPSPPWILLSSSVQRVLSMRSALWFLRTLRPEAVQSDAAWAEPVSTLSITGLLFNTTVLIEVHWFGVWPETLLGGGLVASLGGACPAPLILL